MIMVLCMVVDFLCVMWRWCGGGAWQSHIGALARFSGVEDERRHDPFFDSDLIVTMLVSVGWLLDVNIGWGHGLFSVGGMAIFTNGLKSCVFVKVYESPFRSGFS